MTTESIASDADVSQGLSKERWAVFGVVALAYLLVFAQRTGPGLITNHLQAEFHVTAATLGTMTSIQYLLYMLLQIPVGLFGDRFGPERLFVAGVMFDGVGTLVFSEAHVFAWLLIGRAVVGLGDALIWVNIVLILAKRFLPQEFGVLLGLVGTGGNIGALLTTLPFAAWISAVGWRQPFFLLGLALLVVGCLAAVLFLRSNRRVGALPRAVVAHPAQTSTAPKIVHVPVLQVLHRVVRARLAWATFACHFGIVGTYMGFVSLWAVPFFIASYHIGRSQAAWFTLIAFVGALVGGPVTGAVSDRLGRRRMPYLWLQGLAVLAWVTMWVGGGHLPAAVTALQMFVLGFGNGGSLLTFAAIRDQTEPSQSGVMSGFANAGGFLSAVLLPVLYGAVVDFVSPRASSGVPATAHAMAMGLLVPAVFSLVGFVGAVLLPEFRH